MQIQAWHIPQTHSSLSNITSNHFAGNIPDTFSLSALLLSAVSLILCHTDGCNCQMVLYHRTLICGGSESSGWERLAVAVGSCPFGPGLWSFRTQPAVWWKLMEVPELIFLITPKQTFPSVNIFFPLLSNTFYSLSLYFLHAGGIFLSSSTSR